MNVRLIVFSVLVAVACEEASSSRQGGGGAGKAGASGGPPEVSHNGGSAGEQSASIAGGGASGASPALWGFDHGRPKVQETSDELPGFRRGITLGNRLDAPSEGAWGPFLLASDFEFAAEAGFDHVRLPVRFSAHAAAASPYTLDEDFLVERVDFAIDEALGQGLNIIVDLHHYEELHQDPDGHADRFLAIWEQLSKRYSSRPAGVIFELLNEPNGELTAARWRDLAAEAVASIREDNPDRVILIAAPEWSAPSEMDSLEVPDDPNVVAVFHFYEPSLFTLQGKSFMSAEWGTTGVLFPGPPDEPLEPVAAAAKVSWVSDWFASYNSESIESNPSGPKTIFDQFELIEAYLRRTGGRVHNGEFAAQDGADLSSRARWFRLVRQECERRSIGWSVWEDSSGTRLFDPDTGEWESTLLDALMEDEGDGG